MEPITVQLPNLSGFGPFWYLLAHLAVAIFLIIIAFRNIAAAGKYGSSAVNATHSQEQTYSYPEKMNSHIARAIISGIFGIVNIIVVICMSAQLFHKSVEAVYPSQATAEKSTNN